MDGKAKSFQTGKKHYTHFKYRTLGSQVRCKALMTGQKPYVGGVTLLLVQKKSILDTSQSTKSDLLLCFGLAQVSPEHPVIPKTSLHVYQFGITFFFLFALHTADTFNSSLSGHLCKIYFWL